MVAAGAGLVQLPVYAKVALAVLLVGAYAFYVRQTIRPGGGEQEEPPEWLWLWPFGSEAPTWAVCAQLALTVGAMAVGAHFFVGVVEHLSKAAGIPAGIIALVLAPLATELPEKFNSVYWMRDNEDTLAFGNITGAMVFQSMIPVALGLVFTPWGFGFLNTLAAGLALLSGGLLYGLLGRKGRLRGAYLLLGGVFYAAFLAAALVSIL